MLLHNTFPHLKLSFQGTATPLFATGISADPEVARNRRLKDSHVRKLREQVDSLQAKDRDLRAERAELDLPDIPAGTGFLLNVSPSVDLETLTHSLGVELVAETNSGVMLVSTEDISLNGINQIIGKFETTGSGYGSQLLDIYDDPTDARKLAIILSEGVQNLLPLDEHEIYTFDLGIQTATSTHDFTLPTIQRQKSRGETVEQANARREVAHRAAWDQARDSWKQNAQKRLDELKQFVDHYAGDYPNNSPEQSLESRIPAELSSTVFPDSVQVRVSMTGGGFNDLIKNFPHLFEVTLPPEIQLVIPAEIGSQEPREITLLYPSNEAPKVCVIDSGIQEEHKWLEPAIDKPMSRCFVRDEDPNDVADYVGPQGHGTRVAGAILFPSGVPKEGEVEPIAWIQNARVLDERNQMRSDELPPVIPKQPEPPKYLEAVVAHFQTPPSATKIYNQSINNSLGPCPPDRMTAWAAKMDELSHSRDVLFIQSAGNQIKGIGEENNPGIQGHLDAKRHYPHFLLEPSMRISDPAQSLHALTVGSIAGAVYRDEFERSLARHPEKPSAFSRCGFGEPWSTVKPEVVEIGGDLIYSPETLLVREHTGVSVELLNSTMHGAPAYSKDGVGTSFSTPKVTHIAAALQTVFPHVSPLLYRALIVQSARWPQWAENSAKPDNVLRLIGYGIPSLERAMTNSDSRVTLITPEAKIIRNKQYDLYVVTIPDEIRSAASEAKIRVDITLAYTSMPRRTRVRRTGYLETWLEWRASKSGESLDEFKSRIEEGGSSHHSEFRWMLHQRAGEDYGIAEDANRNNGTVQKDWAVFEANELPKEFAIAVSGHVGWNHRSNQGEARYCLVVTFEALDSELQIYSLIESEIEIETGEIETII